MAYFGYNMQLGPNETLHIGYDSMVVLKVKVVMWSETEPVRSEIIFVAYN